MPEVIGFLRRHGWLLAGAPLVAGLGAWVVISFFLPPTYEASATLVVAPPTFSSELTPETFSVQSYQKLLESDAVISTLKDRLVREGEIEPEAPLRLGHELETRTFHANRANEAPVPMIQAVARHRVPETAGAVANAWPEVFLDLVDELTRGTASSVIELVEGQYSQAETQLLELERARDEIKQQSEERYAVAANEWRQRLATASAEAAELEAAYHTETRRAFAGVAEGLGIPVPAVTGEAPSDEVHQILGRLLVVRRELAQTLPYLTLERGPSDEIVWEGLASSSLSEERMGTVLGATLGAQEVNPVHGELSLRAAQLEMELAGLSAARRLEASEVSGRLERLQREREAGLRRLKEQRAADKAVLERRRAQALEAIERETETRLEQTERVIRRQDNLFARLSEQFNEATIAKAQQDLGDVRLATAAVVPLGAEPKRTLLKSFLIAGIAGVLALLAALVRDFGKA